MKTKLIIALCCAVLRPCAAEQVLAEYDWSKLAQSGQLFAGVPVNIDGRAALRLANTNNSALRLQIVKLSKPPITRKLYAIVGEVKYDQVRDDGYLEMWNYFPPTQSVMPEGAYFSRTLGDSGDMGTITGTSDWRHFMLPFDRTGTSECPTRLEINLFLPAQGVVYLGPIKLVEYTGSFASVGASSANAWWPDWAGGLIGGTGGAVLGCLGSLLGWLASRGKAQAFVLTTLKTLIGLGIISMLAGLAALGLRQPYGVWFVLLLAGVLLLGILPFKLKEFQKNYAALELRKMAALDA